MEHNSKVRYARQIIMPEITEVGQIKLLQSKVIVIGAGGLGSPCLLYLASSGVGAKAYNGVLAIADFDKLELSNLQRQIIHENSDIKRNKAESARDAILDLNPEVNVQIYKNKINNDNILDILSKYDVIIDGSDNFETRFLVNDACLALKKPLISGAILRFEGQAACFRPYLSKNSPCYRCFYPDIPPQGTMPNCSTNGIIAPIAGIIGSLQALYAIKIITGNDEGLDGFVTIFDGKNNNFRKVKLSKDSKCICQT